MPYSTDREALARQCKVEFFKSSGPGGQHRNKRETAVRLIHDPTGITVTATERRSQSRNLEEAYKRLELRLQMLNRKRKKRIATKRPKIVDIKRLEAKRRLSMKKRLRGKVDY